MMNAVNSLRPRGQQEAKERKEEAFDILCEKLSYYAALAECVEDSVEGVTFMLDNEEHNRKADKLVALVYLLNDGLQQLRDYILTVY